LQRLTTDVTFKILVISQCACKTMNRFSTTPSSKQKKSTPKSCTRSPCHVSDR